MNHPKQYSSSPNLMVFLVLFVGLGIVLTSTL